MNTGEILKNLRKEKGLTQTEVGKHLGITKSAVQKYESGEVKNIKLETIRKLCLFFNIMPYELIFPENKDMFKLYKLNMTFDPVFIEYLSQFEKLNEKGKKKVLEYSRDILAITHYRNN